MVHVGSWRNLTLLTLCHSCLLLHSDASVSIIEQAVESTVFVTSAATSNTEPIWLVLPMLLDVQPVLLKVDMTRPVPAQIQNFCQHHGIDTTRCAGAIREALDEVVNFQKFCKNQTAESALPGFVVTKNVLKEGAEAASASWLQNDPEDVAIDFCGFAQGAKTECVEALDKALQLSFDWMLALTPCEQQAEGSDRATESDTETQSIADRLATIEEMISALQSSSEGESEVAPSVLDDELAEDSDASFHDDGDTVEEISESEDAASVAAQEYTVDTLEEATAIDNIEENVGQVAVETDIVYDQVEDEDTANVHNESTELEEVDSGKEEETETEEEVQEAQDAIEVVSTRNLPKENEVAESEAVEVSNGSNKAAYKNDELSRIGEELGSQKTWKVGAALVLVLSILYLVIDLMLHCVHYMVGHLGAPKQLVSVLLHDIQVVVGGRPRSKLKDSYSKASRSENVKKPVSRRPKVAWEKELTRSKQRSKTTGSHAQDDSVKANDDAHHHSSPSFTCVAMLLMASSHAPIATDSTILTQNTPTSSFVQDSNEALNIIQHQYERELAAAQRIQNAWKAAQRKSLLKQEWENVAAEDVDKSDSGASIFRLFQLNYTETGHENSRESTGTAGLRRLVSDTMPPL